MRGAARSADAGVYARVRHLFAHCLLVPRPPVDPAAPQVVSGECLSVDGTPGCTQAGPSAPRGLGSPLCAQTSLAGCLRTKASAVAAGPPLPPCPALVWRSRLIWHLLALSFSGCGTGAGKTEGLIQAARTRAGRPVPPKQHCGQHGSAGGEAGASLIGRFLLAEQPCRSGAGAGSNAGVCRCAAAACR